MSASADVVPRHDGNLADCVAALHESHLLDRYPMVWPDDPLLWLCPPHALAAWIVPRDGVVGHVVLAGRDPECAEISRLFVAPRAQRAGLAVALLDVAIDYAATIERRVELNVVEDSEAAIRLYERLGWTLLGREPAPFTWPDGSRPTERRYAAPASRA